MLHFQLPVSGLQFPLCRDTVAKIPISHLNRLTPYLNSKLGRRGTIVLTAWISAIACLAQAFSPNWKFMLGFRLLLGLGIGPKSTTIPIFAAESAPKHIRGTLVMVWQLFTALGIMLGYAMGLAFGNVQEGYKCNDIATKYASTTNKTNQYTHEPEWLPYCVSAG